MPISPEGTRRRGRTYFDLPDSEAEFQRLYGAELLCREDVVRRRWPSGFRCGRCGGRRYEHRETPKLRCLSCGRHTSLIRGTIFQSTKLPLAKWYRAAFLMRWVGANASYLSRALPVTYKTAWLLAHKLRAVMATGVTEVKQGEADPRTAAPGPTLSRALGLWRFDGGLELTWSRPGSAPRCGCARLDAADLSEPCDDDDPELVRLRIRREAVRGARPRRTPLGEVALHRLRQQYSGSLSERHFQAYLDEFCFRFNRRVDGLWATFASVVRRLVHVEPLPYKRLVKPVPATSWAVVDLALAPGRTGTPGVTGYRPPA